MAMRDRLQNPWRQSSVYDNAKLSDLTSAAIASISSARKALAQGASNRSQNYLPYGMRGRVQQNDSFELEDNPPIDYPLSMEFGRDTYKNEDAIYDRPSSESKNPSDVLKEDWDGIDVKSNSFGYETRDPYDEELKYFRNNKNVGGMATEDGKIILNPYSDLSNRQKESIIKNEATRLFIRDNNIPLNFSLTEEQRNYFKGTPYSNDEESAKASIISRIISGDSSAGNTTIEQRNSAKEIMNQINGIEDKEIEDGNPVNNSKPAIKIEMPTPKPLDQTNEIYSVDTDYGEKSLSEKFLNLISSMEGFKSKAYWDNRQWSIGYGSKASGPNETISKQDAELRRNSELVKHANYVAKEADERGLDLTDNQFEALVSFSYNTGQGNLSKMLDGAQDNINIIPSRMALYNKAKDSSGKLVENKGLTNRRRKEIDLFLGKI